MSQVQDNSYCYLINIMLSRRSNQRNPRPSDVTVTDWPTTQGSSQLDIALPVEKVMNDLVRNLFDSRSGLTSFRDNLPVGNNLV